MFSRVLKVLIGFLLIPISVSFSVSLFKQIGAIQTVGNTQSYFLYGIASYAFLHLILFRPVYLYILGHELMHVLATWLCGGSVSSFHISSKGGSVKTSKSNFFIALAPYFFPTYTILTFLVFILISIVKDINEYVNLFIFMLGFTLIFHFIMTIEMIRKKQPDIIKTGYIFSGNLIYIVNILILALILSALFKEVNFGAFLSSSILKTKDIYSIIFTGLF